VALSRGVDDLNVFVPDYRNARYLPFERDPTTGSLVLTFFHADAGE
jgi:hypothetical protein